MQQFASKPGEPRRQAVGIDWEPMPSLAHLVRPARGDGPNWADTRPADPEDFLFQDAGFAEPLPGLTVQETFEPEIFRLFFGRPPLLTLGRLPEEP